MNYAQISATTQVKLSAAKLRNITVSSTSSGTIAIYDTEKSTTSGVPLVLATMAPAVGSHLDWDDGLFLSKGLYIVVSGTIQLTIGYE